MHTVSWCWTCWCDQWLYSFSQLVKVSIFLCLQGYRVISGLVMRPWCLMEVISRREIIDIVTDAFKETEKIGLYANIQFAWQYTQTLLLLWVKYLLFAYLNAVIWWHFFSIISDWSCLHLKDFCAPAFSHSTLR